MKGKVTSNCFSLSHTPHPDQMTIQIMTLAYNRKNAFIDADKRHGALIILKFRISIE